MADILLDVKTAIIKILKNANTIAEDRVREGLTIALNNPFSTFTAPDEQMPLLVVQVKRVSYEQKTYAEYKYRVQVQIDGYIKQDSFASTENGINLDEQLDRNMDTLALQVQNAIQFYQTFRKYDGDDDLNLQNIAEMKPSETVKNNVDQDQEALLGSISMMVDVEYSQPPQFETLEDLQQVNSKLRNGPEADIIKEITLT